MLFVHQDVSALQRRIEELERQLVKTPLPIAQPVPTRPILRGLVRPEFPRMKNPIKNCPAKKGSKIDDPMLPCELYGIEVDVSQQGIWFDGRAADGQEEELISVLRKIDKPAAANIKKLFKSPAWGDQHKKKIEIARAKAEAYAAAVSQLEAAEKKRAAAEEKARRAPNDAVAKAEHFAATQEFEKLAATERSLRVDAKLNITPGFVEKELPPEEGADSNEISKGCPAKPGERMIKMELLGVVLDVSPTGIWFDGVGGNRTKPELVELLEKFKDSNTGPLSFFKNFENQKKANFNAKIAERVALISKHTMVYNEYSLLMRQAKFHRADSAIYKHFMDQADAKYQEFAGLSAGLRKPVKL